MDYTATALIFFVLGLATRYLAPFTDGVFNSLMEKKFATQNKQEVDGQNESEEPSAFDDAQIQIIRNAW